MTSYSVSGLTKMIKGRWLSGYSWIIIVLGIFLISGLWMFVCYQINDDYNRTIAETSTVTMNLATTFEEHVRGIIADADKDLLILKQAYEQEGISSPVLAAYVNSIAKDPTRNQVAICDEQGNIILSFNKKAYLTNIADREYFHAQRDTNADTLFIGKPIRVRVTGQNTIPLTRRINKPDGSFGGIVYIGLKVDYFVSIYQKIDLGQNQLISLTGSDGFIRVRRVGDKIETDEDSRDGRLWKNVQSGRTEDSFLSTNILDGVTRLTSYRVMDDYPLIVAVGKSTQVALAGYEQRTRGYMVGASVVSILILIICALIINRYEKTKRLTLAVQQEKDRLSSLINSISDEVWFADTQNKLTLANPAAFPKCDTNTEIAIENQAPWEVLRPDGSARPLEEAPPLRALHGEVIKNQQEIIRTSDSDEFRYREVSSNPVRDVDGNIIGSVSIVRDITERNRLEEELRKNEAILRVVTDNYPDPIYLKDCQSRILFANPAMVEVMAKPLVEILGKNETEIYDNPAIGQSILEADRRIMNAGFTEVVEQNVDKPEGRRIFLDSKTPWRDAAGSVIGLIGVSHDITERKLMEDELKKNRNQLQEINATLEEEIAERQATQEALATSHEELKEINSILEEEIMERQMAQDALHDAHDALVVSDTRYRGLFAHMRKAFAYFEIVVDKNGQPIDYKIINANPSFEKMFGCKAVDVLGERWSYAVPETKHGLFNWLQTFSEKVIKDQSIDFEQQVSVDDKYYQISAYSPEKGYVAVLIADITESKRQEEQMKYYADEVAATNAELKSFVNTIAHDFRSPMVNLKGFSTELGYTLAELKQIVHDSTAFLPQKVQVKVDELLDKDVADAQQFINSSVDRLNRMVDALLNLARMGRREMNYQIVDMSKLVNTVLLSYGHQISEENIQIDIGVLPNIQTDPLTMEQIISNLVDNAIKYLDPSRQGKITVNCTENKNEYVVSIKDNGRGIAAIDCEKIFEPFRRSGKQDQPGEGLGLAYIRTLSRKLGGRVWCESEIGVGTTMSLTIPNDPFYF